MPRPAGLEKDQGLPSSEIRMGSHLFCWRAGVPGLFGVKVHLRNSSLNLREFTRRMRSNRPKMSELRIILLGMVVALKNVDPVGGVIDGAVRRTRD
jgi:hypothetical protein